MVGANRRKRIKAEVLLRDWQPVDGVVRILPAVVCPHVLFHLCWDERKQEFRAKKGGR